MPHISLLQQYGYSATTSGAIVYGVPINVDANYRDSSLAVPKSPKYALSSPSINMFCVLTSRCITYFE